MAGSSPIHKGWEDGEPKRDTAVAERKRRKILNKLMDYYKIIWNLNKIRNLIGENEIYRMAVAAGFEGLLLLFN